MSRRRYRTLTVMRPLFKSPQPRASPKVGLDANQISKADGAARLWAYAGPVVKVRFREEVYLSLHFHLYFSRDLLAALPYQLGDTLR